ncbi:hypothetical protein IW142_004273 [Coemansia sp. RSA 564]|nr:hypothetical protein IW142_004273 [Coemansia sp. RSA 564]
MNAEKRVKCGSEKPECTNCVKYRCTCVYMPSVRHLRVHTASGSVSKATYKQRKQCVALEVASSISARAVRSVSSDSSGDMPSLSLSQLMKPVAPFEHGVQGSGPGPAVHMQIAATTSLPPLQYPQSQQHQSQQHQGQQYPTILPPPKQYPTMQQPPKQYPTHPQIQIQANSHSTQQPQQPQQQPRQQTMLPNTLFGSRVSPQVSVARTLSPHSTSDGHQSTSPLISSPLPWRQTLTQQLHPDSPRTRQRLAADESAELSSRGISDILRGLSLPSAEYAPAITEKSERSASMAASVSSVGSVTHSPAFSNLGIDPKQIEASLPQPAPDSLDNMLKAYFRYQYPSSGIVLEEFFWYRYHRNMLTPLIIYAMLAVATWSLATDECGERGKYGNAHETFYRTAKQHVEDAMDEAHLRSVQGLLVLANYEALVGRWGTMWNHTTMARRLAEGIILRNTDFPWRDVQQPGFDFEYQRVQRAYWHSLINDIWASVLMDKQVGGIEIALPPKPTHDFTYRYIRLVHSDTAPGYHVSLGPDGMQDPRHGCTAASGELFLLIGAINNAAYLFQHAGKQPLIETFIDFEMRLTNWYLKLPKDVRLDDATITRFTSTPQCADLGEVISTHLYWNFSRLLLMRMGLVLSLQEDPSLLRNIYSTKAFYTTDSRALQFYQSSMPILTPDKAASYDQWLFHFCRCMSLQSTQNVVNLLKLGERYNVHPGHFGAGLNLPLVQVVSVSLGLVCSPDSQVVRIALDHLITVIRTLLRLKHWFNTALLLLHLFLTMQDPQLLLPETACVGLGNASDANTDEEPSLDDMRALRAIEASCPFPPTHLITELMRRLRMTFEEFVKEIIRAVRISSPAKDRVDPCISPLLRHLPEQPALATDEADTFEPEWFKYAPSYLRSAWKRLVRTYKSTRADANVSE